MSKSNNRPNDRLKSSTLREELRSQRHEIKQRLRRSKLEELEEDDLESEPPVIKENIP